MTRQHPAVIHVYDAAGNVIETHEHTGDSKSGECKQSIKFGISSDVKSGSAVKRG